MTTLIVIQNVKTKEYFSNYREDFSFDANINEAQTFIDENEVINLMQEDYMHDFFDKCIIEIKKYYKI